MAIQLNLGNQHYASTRPTYIGRPVEAIQQTNAILNSRYVANKAAYQSNIDALDALDVEDQNKDIVQDQADSTKNRFKDVINNNQFEFSDNVVSGATAEIKANKELKGAVVSKAAKNAHFATLDEMVKEGQLGSTRASELKAFANNTNYKRLTVDKDGKVHNSFSTMAAVKDPKIQERIDKYVAMVEKDTIPMNNTKLWNVGHMYLAEGTETKMDKAKMLANVTSIVMSEPDVQAYIAQSKRLHDTDIIAKTEDGKYQTDDNGNVITDINLIDGRERAKKLLGWSDEDIKSYLDAKEASEPRSDINLDNYSQEDINKFMDEVIQSRYGYNVVSRKANASLGLIDNVVYDVRYHQDGMAIAMFKDKLKRKYDKDAAELRLVQVARAQPENTVKTAEVYELSDLYSKNNEVQASYKEHETNMLTALQGLGNANVDITKGIVYDGVGRAQVYDKAGTLHYIEKLRAGNNNGSISSSSLAGLENEHSKAVAFQRNFDEWNSDVKPEDMAAYSEGVKKNLESLIPGGIHNSLSTEINNKLISSGAIERIDTKGAPYTHGSYYKIKNVGQVLSILSSNKDTKKYAKDAVRAGYERAPGYKIANEKYKQQQAQIHDNYSTRADAAILTEPNDIAAAAGNMAASWKTAKDQENNSIMENQSEIEAKDLETAVANGEGHYLYFYENGRRMVAFEGKAEYGSGANKTTVPVYAKVRAQENYNFDTNTNTPPRLRYHNIESQTAGTSESSVPYRTSYIDMNLGKDENGVDLHFRPSVTNVYLDNEGKVLPADGYKDSFDINRGIWYEVDTGSGYTFLLKNMNDVNAYYTDLEEKMQGVKNGKYTIEEVKLIKPANAVEVRYAN